MSDAPSIEGVILAAGLSSRIGEFKPALPVDGKPMVARCIEGMSGVCGRIIVVGGHEIERLRPLLQGFSHVECVENASYRLGMFTSVKAGLAAIRADRCFILPADVPLVPPDVYRVLLSISAEIVIPAFQGRTGHPVCLSKTVLPRILREPDTSSLRDVIRAIGATTVEAGAEEILIDIDTPEAYERICRRFL